MATTTKRLVLTLVGRILVVTKGKERAALFMNATHNPKRKLPRHRPLLKIPLSMVKTRDAAEAAVLTTTAFVNQSASKINPLIDSAAIWSIDGYDLSLRDVAVAGDRVSIEDVANLNKIVESVDKAATFETRILDEDPRRYGILARFRIPPGADIQAVTEDTDNKQFVPGNHIQPLSSYVTITVPFKNENDGPTLTLKSFKTKERHSIKFDGTNYADVEATMTNLCNCKKEEPKRGPGGQLIDDPEFGLYYELVKPRLKQEPLPELQFGAIRIPECFNMARLDFTGISA